MERKDYADKFRDIKNDILKEIRALVPEDSAHHFNENFYVHFIEGEVATTEICSAVEVWSDGMVVFIVKPENADKEEVVEGETVFSYDSDSFLDILDHLKKDVREKKLSYLRDIVAKNGNKLSFDGKFCYMPLLDGGEFNTKLTGLSLNSERVLVIENITQGETFSDGENTITDEHLDRIIEYVESQTKRKFVIRVSGSFSRTFDIEAFSYEEALAEAKKDWEINPLRFDDSNGENWEDYTSLVH